MAILNFFLKNFQLNLQFNLQLKVLSSEDQWCILCTIVINTLVQWILIDLWLIQWWLNSQRHLKRKDWSFHHVKLLLLSQNLVLELDHSPLGKTLMLGKIEGRKRSGWQRMRWLYSITDPMDVNLSKLSETVVDRGALWAAVHGVAKSQTWLSDSTTFGRDRRRIMNLSLCNLLFMKTLIIRIF